MSDTGTPEDDDLDEEQGDQSPEVPADLLELHVAIETFGEDEPA